MAAKPKNPPRNEGAAPKPLPKKLSPRSRQLLKELPNNEDIARKLKDLKKYGHAATALMGASYLDHALEHLLRSQFRDLHPEDDARMFGGAQGGLLATFSAKIRMTYTLGWIHENPYKALLLVNDIRNVFAHSLHIATFQNKYIQEDCQRLAEISPAISASANLKDDEPAIDIYTGVVALLYHSIKRLTDGDTWPFPALPGKPPSSD